MGSDCISSWSLLIFLLLIETYHLSLRKGCGDMKIQNTVLPFLYISCHVASNIAFQRLKSSHV